MVIWQKNKDGKYEQKKVPKMIIPAAPELKQSPDKSNVVHGRFGTATIRRPGMSFQCSPQHHHKRRKAA